MTRWGKKKIFQPLSPSDARQHVTVRRFTVFSLDFVPREQDAEGGETCSPMHASLCLAKACASLQAHPTKDVGAPGALHFHKGFAFKNTATLDGFIVDV
jgi:hypothetical protein